jgi:ADP-heptose:LPS heptosyltransferase
MDCPLTDSTAPGTASGQRVVVLRALGLGDLLTGVPALRALRDACPRADITLAAPAALAPLAALSDAVDRVADTAPLAPLAPALHRADLAVDLHGRGPESTRLLLATTPRRLIAFRHPDLPDTGGLPDWTPHEHEVARWCRLLTECGIPADPDPRRLRLRRPGIPSRAAGAVIIHPGAASAARRWPAVRWAAVARLLRADGWRVIVTGSRAERRLATGTALLAGLPASSVLAGETSLAGLAALVADARLVLSGDTGMAHLAAAYERPAVTLAGPVPPSLWGPPARPWHAVLWAGRCGDPHAAVPDPGLLQLTVRQVADAAGSVLAADLSRRSGGPARRGAASRAT